MSTHLRVGTIPGREEVPVYPGAVFDAAMLYGCVTGLADPEIAPFAIFGIPFLLVDLPLSAALDTICLPYDLIHRPTTSNGVEQAESTVPLEAAPSASPSVR